MKQIFLALFLYAATAHAQSHGGDTDPVQTTYDSITGELEAALTRDAAQRGEPFPATEPTGSPVTPSTVNANDSNPAISVILDFAGAWFDRDNHFRQGGHAPNRNGPAIQGAELGLSASIDPYFSVDVAFGMFHLHLEEAYLTTTALPWNLKLRAGKFKANIGRHNPVHLHSWNFVNQPLANEWLFGAEGLSLPGMELSWLAPLPWYVELSGSIQLGSAGSFRSKSISDGEPMMTDFIYPLRFVQFFEINDDNSLQLGLNAVLGTGSEGAENGNRCYAWGLDMVYKWRPTGQGRDGFSSLQWETEAWFRQMEVPLDVWNDAGGYSALIAGISKRWQASFRTELWRQLGKSPVENRTSYGVDSFKISTAISFMPSHFSRIRLQHNVESMDAIPTGQSVFLQMEVSGGAHAAHGF